MIAAERRRSASDRENGQEDQDGEDDDDRPCRIRDERVERLFLILDVHLAVDVVRHFH